MSDDVNRVVIGSEDTGPEAPPTPTPDVSPRPEWLPEKFGSPEELAKSYAELEKKLGGTLEGAPKEPPAGSDPVSKFKETQNTVQEAAKTAGVDLQALAAEWEQNGGDLTEESYKTLEEKGYSKAMVQSIVRGQEALVAQTTREVMDAIGGEESFAALKEWAGENLTDSEKASYQKVLDLGDMDTVKTMLRGIHARMVNETGVAPQRMIQGNGRTAAPERGFASRYEMATAVNDPRYAKDDAYRAEVEKRILASEF